MDKEIKTNFADWKSDLQDPDLGGLDEEDRKLALLEHQNAALREKLERAKYYLESLHWYRNDDGTKYCRACHFKEGFCGNVSGECGLAALLSELDAQPEEGK